jgi:hypothetical protein
MYSMIQFFKHDLVFELCLQLVSYLQYLYLSRLIEMSASFCDETVFRIVVTETSCFKMSMEAFEDSEIYPGAEKSPRT